MKKLYLIFALSVFYTVCAQGYSFKEGSLYYNITSTRDMTVEVTYGDEQYEASSYFIPEYVVHDSKRYFVDRIGDKAFSGDNYLTSIRIPSNINSVGDYAFSGCFSLSSVVIDESTTTLSLGGGARNGSSLFADAKLKNFFWGRPLSYNTSNGYSPIAKQAGLSNITIGPNVTTITPYMFYGNLAISSIDLPTTVTSLGDHAFHGFMGLKSFTVPDHITSIGEYAFAGCSGLTSFTLPEWMSSIGTGMFSGCTGLTSFVIPKTVNNIGNSVFNGCTSLERVVIVESDEWLTLGCNNYHYYNNDPEGRGLFFDCPLTSVYIGRNLSYNTGDDYGNSPFAKIETLTEAHFGDPVKTIQSYLFRGCKSLKTLLYKSQCAPASIEKYAFWGCTSLTGTDLVFPESVQTICEGAFRYCISLEDYTIPNHITTVENNAFMKCEKLKNIVIKPSVKSIGNYAFNGCTSLERVVIVESDEWLTLGYNNYHYYNNDPEGRGLFFDCPLTSVYIGRNLSYNTGDDYGNSPFAKIETLTEAHFGDPVKTIQPYLFRDCKSLKTLLYKDKCAPTSIEKYAFWGCTSLTGTDIVFPESVQTIGEGAFRYCISVEEYIIPSQILTIEDNAFMNCSKLQKILIGPSVKTVGNSVFQNCEKMANVTISPSVKSIGNYAFNGCTSLERVVIVESDEWLTLGYNNYHYYNNDPEGRGLFFDCPLTSVYIGRNLSYNTYDNYGNSPFARIETLTEAHFGDPVKTIQPYLFRDCKSLKTLLYKSQCAPASIEKYAFWGCTSLTGTDLVFPESVQTIGEGAFRYCISLEDYTIPNHITTVENNAFMNCEKLKSLVVKPSVKSIGNYAFNGCTSLERVVIVESDEWLTLGYNNYHNYSSDPEGRGLFFDCPLTSVYIGRNLSYNTGDDYGNSPFAKIETLTEAHFGDPVKTIQPYLFRNCKSLKTLLYKDECAPTSIEKYAFWGCTSLTETDIVFPESVQTIGEGAFRYCISLEGYTIPNHITTVENSAFMNCEKLAAIVVKPSVKSIGNYAFNGCTSLTGVVFEEGDETLTLGYNNYHKNNSDPEGRGLFFDCPLISTFIGRNLSYNTGSDYGNSPFAKNESLTKVHFGNPIKSIPAYLLYGCKSMTSLEYNSNCAPTVVGSYAFCGCKLLTWDDISLPLSIETIENGAFKDCESIRSIVIKPAVKSIGNYVFNGCTKITGVVFEEGEETLTLGYNNYHKNNSDPEGRGLFFDCPLISTFIGRNLSYYTGSNYGTSPFANFSTLTSALIGNPVTRIPDYIFQGDTELNKIEFNKNCQLQSVGKYAFDGCVNLSTPQFPSTVTVFEEGAFRGCTNFMDFELPENLETIGSYAFQNCTGFTTFTFLASMTSIGNYAFSGCTGVKELTFADGEGTLALGYGASQGKNYGLFNDCPLEELYLGRTVSYDVNSNGNTGYSPFYKQEGLDKITVGPNVKELPYCIFWGSAIKEIYVPSSVTTVHSSFVNNCPNLKNVIILGATPPSVDNANTLLSGSAEASKFYVFFPDKYKSAKNWSNYADKIDACCEIYSDLTYSGEGHAIGYKTDFPIVLENRDTETAEAGTYKKRIDVTYTTNGYNLKDVLDYEYTIKKAPLTITANSYTRSYGEENPELTFEYDGFVDGEDEKVITKEPVATTKATATSGVGEYDITVSGAEAKNYEITYVKATLTVTKAPLTIAAKSYTIRQGEALPKFELEYTGFKNDETTKALSKQPDVKCEASSATLPGEYDIVVSDAEAANYEINYENGKLVILPYSKGDVNNDGYVDVADLAGVVHFILGESTDNLVFDSADMDESGKVEINDYAALVKLILSGQRNNIKTRRSPANLENLISLSVNDNGELLVNLLEDRQFTGLQFDLMLPEGVTLVTDGVQSESPQHGCWSVRHEDGKYRIVCSSMSNAELHEGVVLRLKIDNQIEGIAIASNIVLSDKFAQRHESASVQTQIDDATAIAQLTGDELIVRTGTGTLSLLSGKDKTVKVFGVNGVLMSNLELVSGVSTTIRLPAGIYVVENKKVTVR